MKRRPVRELVVKEVKRGKRRKVEIHIGKSKGNNADPVRENLVASKALAPQKAIISTESLETIHEEATYEESTRKEGKVSALFL